MNNDIYNKGVKIIILIFPSKGRKKKKAYGYKWYK